MSVNRAECCRPGVSKLFCPRVT